MSRSNRHKEKLEIKNENNPDNGNEETAARTRPFSYDEIMLRRKKKKADLLTKPVEAGNLSKEVSKEKVPDSSQSSKPYRNTKLSSIVVTKHSSEDTRKVKSRDTDGSIDSDRIMRKEGRDNRDRMVRPKAIMNRTVTDIRHNQWSRNHGNNRNEFERRNSRHVVEREIYADRSRGRPVKVFDRKLRNYDEERKFDREIERKQRNDNAERRIEPKSVKNFDKKPRNEDEEKNSEKEIKRKQRNGDEEEGIRQNSMKKHDSGKRQDQETSERKDHVHKERKESLYNEAKKKRSRSREREKNNGRRSTSLSPKSHRHVSNNDDKRDKMSKKDDERNKMSKTEDERNRMSKTEDERNKMSKNEDERNKKSKNDDERNKTSKIDDERNKISRNGSSGRYRRRGESPSGLGGYSPRKRRTVAAVKTPSPPHLSPEKKTAGWDLPPPGENTSSTLPILTNVIFNTHELPSIAPVTSMPVKGIPGVFSYASVDSVQLTQATRPMRRLYVENLPESASEKTVMECLNNFLLTSGVNRVPGSQPCISCSLHKEKGQALVEFLTPEDASAALYFDGRYLSGSALKIRRPKDYTEVATGVADKSLVSLDTSSNYVRDSPNKIFIGGIPKVISSEMLREIAASFGPIKAFHFKVNVDLDGPCAFLEYTDESVTLKACAGLNAMRLGGKLLTVVQATPDASSVEIFGNPPFYGIPQHSKPLLQKPTQVLKLKNALNPDGLSSLSEQELEEMLEDVRLECVRFGTVNSVNVVKHCDSDSMPDGIRSANDEGIHSLTKMKSEHLGEQIDDGSQESSMLEAPSDNLNQIEEVDKTFENEGANDEDNTAVNVASHINIEKVASELALEINPSLTSADLHPNGNKIDGNIKTLDAKIESKAMAEESLKTDSKFAEAAFMNSSEAKKDDDRETDSKFEDPFETGSILVEYKRIEASSVAAHFLHGRLFDDRTVTVEYVDYDVYRDRFLKFH